MDHTSFEVRTTLVGVFLMMATKSFYEINKIIDPNLYFERLREIMMKNNQLSVQI